MIRRDLTEAVSVARTVLNALLDVIVGKTGLAGAQLRFLCGRLAANTSTELNAGGTAFYSDLITCFEAAPAAGATFVALDAVRAVTEGLSATGLPAIAIQNLSIRMCLAEQARVLSATTFVSRQDVDSYFDAINASFDRAETIAADNLDNVAYRALISIHAAVSNDLANRARPLPRMVTYAFPQRMPSLWLAQRVYYDASRASELVAENKPIHPLFMTQSGVALSA